MTSAPVQSPAPGSDSREEAKAQLLDAVRKFHQSEESDRPFVPGVTPLYSSGPVFDDEDRVALVEAALEMRIVAAGSAQEFESRFSKTIGVRKSHLVNSGSSANLLAISALTSPQLADRRLVPGDEVITVAAGFPTTVNPVLQNGLVPVFVDTELGTYNASVDTIAAAIGPKTKAISLAHTLGNPYAAREIAELAQEHELWLVEDNCDALGARYDGRLTGTFGDLSTLSCYPAHHITMGEGGVVSTSDLHLARIVESLRDWGRDCWCAPGEDNKCAKRFRWQLGTLPEGYDHKYIYSHVGYNLKATDSQAALGLTQLAKLPVFIEARRRNWQRLHDALADVPGLLLPSATPNSEPSWFGFVLTVLPDAPFTRRELVAFLEARSIGTRQVFAGNLTRHPAYQGTNYRVAGDLTNSDIITEHSFWIGVHPGLTDEKIDYMAQSVTDFVRSKGR
ncbi:lipopolysaccharide biosynthesis protein RfbH [Streptomyces sp. NPDC002730]|uniref:lipopolysaccharide biosynthesis protein RfbH n=1 Tax=Streptomyces sp. NPDC002730 TaxID=3364662 RepID=UPI00367BAC3C